MSAGCGDVARAEKLHLPIGVGVWQARGGGGGGVQTYTRAGIHTSTRGLRAVEWAHESNHPPSVLRRSPGPSSDPDIRRRFVNVPPEYQRPHTRDGHAIGGGRQNFAWYSLLSTHEWGGGVWRWGGGLEDTALRIGAGRGAAHPSRTARKRGSAARPLLQDPPGGLIGLGHNPRRGGHASSLALLDGV